MKAAKRPTIFVDVIYGSPQRKRAMSAVLLAIALVACAVSGYPFGMECEDNPDLCKEG